MAKKAIHFKAIPSINGRDFSNYKVSDKQGLILNVKQNQLMQTPLNNCNYRQVCIRDHEGKAYVAQVARLVALAWVENNDPDVNTEVIHLNEEGRRNNPSDDDAINLKWGTRKENVNGTKYKERRMKWWNNPEWRKNQLEKMAEGRKRRREENAYLYNHPLF